MTRPALFSARVLWNGVKRGGRWQVLFWPASWSFSHGEWPHWWRNKFETPIFVYWRVGPFDIRKSRAE